MASVMHGRRKGTPKKGVPEEQTDLPPQYGVQDMQMNQLQDMTILTKQDWVRINEQLHRKEMEQDKMRKMREERESLKQRSREMVKNWGNTIAGQRKMKLEARKIRDKKVEEERLQMDIEEAKYQQAQRKEILDKAKTQQYYQTDRVKGFHSALLLTEVLKERDAQLELKMLKEKASEGQDQAWADKGRREYEAGIMEDQRAAAARMHAAQSTKGFQRGQVKEHLKARMVEVHEDRMEGEEIQKLAIQHQMDKKRLEDIRKAEMAQTALDNRKQIGDKQKMEEIERMQEEEEDDESRVFAAAKRKMMKLRAEKEKDLKQEQAKRLDRIRDKLSVQMKQKTDGEDDRIRKAIEEQDARTRVEDERSAEKIMTEQQAIAEHRHSQMRRGEEAKAGERMREQEQVKARLAADEVFRRNEEEKYRRRREEALALANNHISQAGDEQEDKRRGRQRELDQHAKTMSILKLEEDQFQEYAGRVIDHCEKHGRNVHPLKKAARAGAGGGDGPQFEGKGGIRPSYMAQDKQGVQLPHYDKDETREVKQAIYGNGDTGKRMGFVW